MARKIRTQIYLDRDQDKLLREQAKKLGISKAELIRRKISQAGASYASGPEAWKEELRFIAERAPAYGAATECDEPEFVPDLKAWEQAKKFMLERLAMDVPQTGRTWTRDELYEDDDE